MKCTNKSSATILMMAVLGAACPLAHADTPPAAPVIISTSGSTAIRNFIASPVTSNAPTNLYSGGQLPGDPNPLDTATGYHSTILEPGVTAVFSNGTFTGAPGNGTQLAPLISSQAGVLEVQWHEQGSVEGILELAGDQIGTPYVGPVVPSYPTASNPIWVNGNYFTAPATVNGFNLSGTGARGTANTQAPVQLAFSDVPAVQGFSIAGTAAVTKQPGQTGYGVGNPALASVPSLPSTLNSRGSVNYPLVAATTLNNPILNPQLVNGTGNLTSTPFVETASTFSANPGTGLTRLNQTDAQWLETAGRLKNGVNFNVATRDVNSGTRNVVALNTGVDPSWATGENDVGNGLSSTGSTSQVSVGGKMTFSQKTAGGGELRPTVENNRMAIGTLSLPDAQGAAKNTISATPLRVLDFAQSTADPTVNNDATAPALDSNNMAVPGQWARPSLKNIVTGAYAMSQNEQMVTVNNYNPTTGAVVGILGDDAGGDAATYKNTVILGSTLAFPLSSFNGPASNGIKQGYVPTQFEIAQRTQDGTAFTLNPAVNQLTFGNPASGFTPDNPDPNSLLGTPSVAGSAGAFFIAAPATITTGGSSPVYGGANSGVPKTNIAVTANNWLFGNFNQTGVRDLASVEAALLAAQALGSNNDSYSARDVNGVGTAANSVADLGATVTYARIAGGIGADGLTTNVTLSKGDIIVMGDYNGDGKFDGADLVAMAKGAAVADSATGLTLTASPAANSYINGVLVTGDGGSSFSDALRNNAILRKNTALDFVRNNTAAYSATAASGSAALINYNLRLSSVGGVQSAPFTIGLGSAETNVNYAFEKADVNSDGKVDFQDAKIVAKFFTKDFQNMTDELAATINSNGTANPSADNHDAAAFDLVNAKLVDGSSIIGQQDLSQVLITMAAHRTVRVGDFVGVGKALSDMAAGASEATMESDLNNALTIDDYLVIDRNHAMGLANPGWADGDLNGDGVINGTDYGLLDASYALYGTLSSGQLSSLFNEHTAEFGQPYLLAYFSQVPEPASLSLLALGTASLMGRRPRK